MDPQPPATPLEILISLHDFERSQGPLVVLPHTHTREFHAQRFGFPKRLRALLLRRRRAYLLNVPAGSAVLLNARVWRAWEANTTSDQRLAVMRITLTPPEPVYDSDEEEGERRSRLANTLAATRDRLPQPARREPLRAAIARCVEAWRRQAGEEGILNEWEDDSEEGATCEPGTVGKGAATHPAGARPEEVPSPMLDQFPGESQSEAPRPEPEPEATTEARLEALPSPQLPPTPQRPAELEEEDEALAAGHEAAEMDRHVPSQGEEQSLSDADATYARI